MNDITEKDTSHHGLPEKTISGHGFMFHANPQRVTSKIEVVNDHLAIIVIEWLPEKSS